MFLLVHLVSCFGVFFFFKQKTAYEMRISDWSSDVCSSDLRRLVRLSRSVVSGDHRRDLSPGDVADGRAVERKRRCRRAVRDQGRAQRIRRLHRPRPRTRSDEHTSELQSLMRISYAVFCLKKNITPPVSMHDE